MTFFKALERLGLADCIMGVGPDRDRHYVTQIQLTPKTRWGWIILRVFHFTDRLCDPHDHGYNFWTFPLTSYEENVMDRETFEIRQQTVKAFRFHWRPRTHTHQVLWPSHGRHEHFMTIAWRPNVGVGPPDFKFWEPIPGGAGKRRPVPQDIYLTRFQDVDQDPARAAE